MCQNTTIKIEGYLDEKWKDWFNGMSICYEGKYTILSGMVKDRAALHGILNQIRDLNMKLISVNSSNEKKNN